MRRVIDCPNCGAASQSGAKCTFCGTVFADDKWLNITAAMTAHEMLEELEPLGAVHEDNCDERATRVVTAQIKRALRDPIALRHMIDEHLVARRCTQAEAAEYLRVFDAQASGTEHANSTPRFATPATAEPGFSKIHFYGLPLMATLCIVYHLLVGFKF